MIRYRDRPVQAENLTEDLMKNKQEEHDMPAGARGRLTTLFFTTLYISAFTFGGGFVIVTFMKKKFVDELKWIDEKEMLDFIALAESCPGAVAVNAAILTGWKVCGPAGMITAVFGTILPPMLIISVISFFYAAFAENVWVAAALRGMQAGVAAVILDVACDLGSGVLKEKSFLSVIIMAAAFFCSFFLNVSVVWIILTAAAAGILRLLLLRRGVKEKKHHPASVETECGKKAGIRAERKEKK